ncbi:hypothetical protein QFZ81_003433 [Paenibacillus sp. V4I9]|nr:hypothetical protein [Paenibacillus sp. V4I9]
MKLAGDLDNKGKQELILYLQSRTKGTTAPIRVIDEIQESGVFTISRMRIATIVD